jgi:hypothetical protein
MFPKGQSVKDLVSSLDLLDGDETRKSWDLVEHLQVTRSMTMQG